MYYVYAMHEMHGSAVLVDGMLVDGIKITIVSFAYE